MTPRILVPPRDRISLRKPKGVRVVGPARAGSSDPFTVLLLHCDGADGSTAFPDLSFTPKTVTANTNAQIDTAQSKFGGASALFAGAGDYLSTPDHADFAFGSGDFTVDLWVRFSSLVIDQSLASQWGATTGWLIRWGAGNLAFYWSADGTALLGPAIFAWAPTVNTWYHVAIVRSGNNLLFFLDGTQVGGAQTITGAIFNSADPVAVGAVGFGGWYFTGWLDEVRISKGVARWTGNFTPPAAPYT